MFNRIFSYFFSTHTSSILLNKSFKVAELKISCNFLSLNINTIEQKRNYILIYCIK